MRYPLPLALAVLLLAGCVPVTSGGLGSGDVEHSREPRCEIESRVRAPLLVLIAQAVPTASQIPCVERLPAGWAVSDIFVRNGRARFALDYDRMMGFHAVEVVLERTCTIGKVTRVPSDHPGTQRYQEVAELRPGQRFRGAIHYLFRGGCVTYRLEFTGDEQARPTADVVLALGFVSREAVAAAVWEYSDGRVTLDPPGGGR